MQHKILLGLGLALIATPGLSAIKGELSAPKSGTVKEKKYCLQYENGVGSRITRQECKAKAEWAKDRVDIDKILNQR